MSKHLALSDDSDAILINGFDDLQKLFDDGRDQKSNWSLKNAQSWEGIKMYETKVKRNKVKGYES